LREDRLDGQRQGGYGKSQVLILAGAGNCGLWIKDNAQKRKLILINPGTKHIHILSLKRPLLLKVKNAQRGSPFHS
jgi:hypothetical protein